VRSFPNGAGNNHLELRGTFRYDHYLPDLNARRYANYLAAYELSCLAGCPAADLPPRAEALKAKNYALCPKCSQAKLPHAACSNCGYVNPSLTLKLGKEEAA